MSTLYNVQQKSILVSLAKYLIIIEPILMVWSFALSNLNVGIIAIIGLYIVFKKKFFLNKEITTAFFLFWIILIIISLSSEYPFFSLKSSFLLVRYYFIIIVFNYLIINDQKFLKNFFWAIFFLSLFLIFDALFQAIIGHNLFGYLASSIENNRISGMFEDELILGKFLLSLFFLIMALKIKIKINSKLFNITISCLFFITILISGERTASFLFIFGLACLIIMPGIYTSKEKMIIITSVFVIFFSLFYLSDRFKYRMIKTTFVELKDSKIFFSTKGHQKHYNLAFEIFKENKFLGIGPNNFRKECIKDVYKNNDKYLCTTHPHNFYIQILAETGIAGFLFAIFFFYKILNFIFINILKKDSVLICLSIAILVNFFPLAPTGNLFGSWLLNINILPLAFLNIHKYKI